MMVGGFDQGRELSLEERDRVLALKEQVEERANRQFSVFEPLLLKT